MPLSTELASGVVEMVEPRTTKRFSPEPSERLPFTSSAMPSL